MRYGSMNLALREILLSFIIVRRIKRKVGFSFKSFKMTVNVYNRLQK